MTVDRDEPIETPWSGKYIAVRTQGRWEYVTRTNASRAVVILAETQGDVILVEQYRFPVGGRCLELPAGLVGDEDENATVEETAVKELEEEAGYTAERIERLGDFHSSPGMVAESFTLVRAHSVSKVNEGGGTEHEDIQVHLVERARIRDFIAEKRRDGVAIDVKLLLFMDF